MAPSVSVDVISESLGVYGGYRLNDRFAVELGYTAALDLGFVEVESDFSAEGFYGIELVDRQRDRVCADRRRALGTVWRRRSIRCWRVR